MIMSPFIVSVALLQFGRFIRIRTLCILSSVVLAGVVVNNVFFFGLCLWVIYANLQKFRLQWDN